MENGWVKIHRKVLSSPVWQNHNLFRVWMWCLMKASHKKHDMMIGNQVVKLEPGQFVCGRESAATDTGLTPQIIRSCFHSLEKMENLTIKTTNKFSVVTIINWDTYQNHQSENNQQITNKEPTNNQQITTNNNDNKEKNKKKYSPELPVEPAGPAIVSIELVLKDQDGNPTLYGVTQKDIDEYADTYPGIDVLFELKKCRQWNHDNPKKRKTLRGIRTHINTWLGRAQDKATRYLPPKKTISATEKNRGFDPDTCEVFDFGE